MTTTFFQEQGGAVPPCAPRWARRDVVSSVTCLSQHTAITAQRANLKVSARWDRHALAPCRQSDL